MTIATQVDSRATRKLTVALASLSNIVGVSESVSLHEPLPRGSAAWRQWDRSINKLWQREIEARDRLAELVRRACGPPPCAVLLPGHLLALIAAHDLDDEALFVLAVDRLVLAEGVPANRPSWNDGVHPDLLKELQGDVDGILMDLADVED